MPYRDLRDFLDTLEREGALARIKAEVDWNEEAGTISQENSLRKGPALLFENIKDHKDTAGRRLVMDLPSSWKRVNLIMELPTDTHPRQIMEVFRERIKHPLKPMLVSTGPCKEVIKRGDEVNLLDFPVPKIHSKDGGRYIMTSSAVITKDLDSGWINAGTYRGMIHDRYSIGALFHWSQHQGVHGRKYQTMKKPMPMAVAIGLDPVMFMCSSAPFPVGVDEYDMVGAIRGEPLEVVRCETSDLLVPAAAEIVLEGEVNLDPATYKSEGPFGEYPGYYTSLWSKPAPVFKVNCVTHRRDPIMESINVGLGPVLAPGGADFLTCTSHSAMMRDHLERHGVQGITGVWTHLESKSTIIYVSIDKLYYGHAKQVAAAIWGHPASFEIGKFVIVVDSDVDIFDLGKVNAAIANRTQGMKDIIIYPWTFGGPLDPSVHPDFKRKTGGIGNWDRVLIDATWPFEWEAREEWGGLKHPPDCRAEKEAMDHVRKRWSEYGIKGEG